MYHNYGGKVLFANILGLSSMASTLLHFWLACLSKSITDTASFIGTNNTGLFYALLLTFLVFAINVFRYVRKNRWKNVITKWYVLIGESVFIGLATLALVWIGHLSAAPHGLYLDIEAQKKELAQRSERNVREISTSLQDERTRLSGIIDSLRSTAAETRADCAAKDAIGKTLEKQNRDQQASINGCLSQALKLMEPEPLKVTAVFLDSDFSNVAARTARWILLSNKTITPVRLVIHCTAQIISAVASPIGSPSLSSGGGKLDLYSWESNIQSPAWTPTAPFLATVMYRGPDQISCSFVPR